MEEEDKMRWFVMRDLKRANAKLPAYKLLEENKIEVFVPMKWCLVTRQGKKVREEAPFMPDLLFAHDTRGNIDPIVERTSTLQYRWLRNTWREPMTVPDTDMDRFIYAVSNAEFPKYYRPEEVTPEMYRRRIRIIGGLFNGYEGGLVTVRGSKVKRLLVELKGLLAAGVEVEPEYIQLVEE